MPLSINLPGRYIIFRNNPNGVKVEQHAHLQNVVEVEVEDGSKKELYTGWYGDHESCHDVCVQAENIRELTEREQTSIQTGKYWELPQQFYQTFRSCPELNGPTYHTQMPAAR